MYTHRLKLTITNANANAHGTINKTKSLMLQQLEIIYYSFLKQLCPKRKFKLTYNHAFLDLKFQQS